MSCRAQSSGSDKGREGYPSIIIGKERVLIGRTGENWTKKIQNFAWNFTASSSNSHFVKKL
jgi:hypothetical protein